jgi:hypothetical protein
MGEKKAVAIVQSNYVPWKGYFDLIRAVDEFILFDDMQYTRRDWRNRNRIKTPQGGLWLTIPVESKGKYLQKICETAISDPGWPTQHWKTIGQFYAKAPYFGQYREPLEQLYRGCHAKYLSQVNHLFLTAICQVLGITTRLSWSMDYSAVEGKTERLVSLCKQAGAAKYVSGPAARDYIDPAQFAAAGIELEYFDYSGYPEYHQLYPPFRHDVSIVDLILNEGPNAIRFMKAL